MVRIGFRGRLVTAMVALVAIVSLTIGALLMVYLFEDEKARAAEQLELGERVLGQVLERRTNLILSRLDVVVRDFGFRSALASGDRATADSALENQSRRAGAEFAIIIDSNDRTIATADTPPIDLEERAGMLGMFEQARTIGYASQFTVFADKPVELIAIQIEAAGLRAQLIAGFRVDADVNQTIERLSGTEVLFRTLNSTRDGFRFLSDMSAIPQSRIQEFAQRTAGTSGNARFIESKNYFSRIVDLTENQQRQLQVVLLINRESALAAYYRRAVEIALLVSAVLVLAALIALLVARGMGKPVRELADFAKAIGDGQFPKPPKIKTGGELAELNLALRDMSGKLKDREDQIRYAASHDELTGLPNKNAFLNHVRKICNSRQNCQLFGIRINDLSNIDDTLGIAFGDKVLCAVANRLRDTLPDSTEISRTAGAEFMVVTYGHADEKRDAIATKLVAEIQRPLSIDKTPFAVRCLLVSMNLPKDAQNVDEVRRRLNLTFEMAQNSRQQITFYQPGHDEDHLRELQIISDLNAAMSNKGLHMLYQPKLMMKSGELTQVEALVRWVHPELGFISPDEFIFLAEQSGQIHDLTRHILSQVAHDARLWVSAGLDIGVAVNLSALDLTRPELIDEVAEAFADWRLPMSRITLEVTESALMEEPETALETLRKLKELGVTLAVDDFGTGYSSLSQLRKLPVQELKIDKSFVLNLDSEPQDQLIVKSTIEMAHGLGLEVVAEGIENSASWRLLQNWGCETGQGFYMSRPVSPTDLLSTMTALNILKKDLIDTGEITS